MPSKKAATKKKAGSLRKGISIDEPLYRAALLKAKSESRSFSFIVRRAIERDLAEKNVTANSPQTLDPSDDLIDITEAGRILRVSVWTMRRRARKAGDPVRLAKSRIGKQKPMHFHRSRIEMIDRGGAAA